MIEASLWAARESPADASGALPSHADVGVVGAGISGLSAALALRRKGASVVVLESETVGFGASSRNGGMALTGLQAGPEELIHRFGERGARAYFDASLRALDRLEAIVVQERIDCAFARCGHIEAASKPRHFADMRAAANVLQQRFGHPVRALDRQELRAELGSNALYGGLLDERSAGLDPGRYVRGLGEAVRRAGGTICERTPVERAARAGAGWRLTTPLGDVTVRELFTATGAYTGTAFPSLQRRLIPLGSYVIATEPLSADLAARLIPRERMVFDSKRLLHYFRLTPDRRMLFGGRAAFVPERPDTTRTSAQILRRDMVAIFPELRDTRVDYAWGGTLDVTFDMMPHAAEFEGMRVALGYAGHGVALATLLGELVAGAIAGGAAPAPFDTPLPAAPLKLYAGRPWFLPLVGVWQRLLDMVS